ncbi:hypothetical protein V5R04_04260 [Jonesiaceae bacterium BS-20]|uniref:Peptidase inhibitor family I36 n=1 Tax=Jonesiaceae bacterium BS-20 TaxID=3120821 RepID=A0AAU7DWQ9_9MICO
MGIAIAMAVSFAGGGVAAAVPASAVPSCASGYVCLFNRPLGSDGLRVAYQYGLSNYVGKTYYKSMVSLNDSVDAVHYNWRFSRIDFWTGSQYQGVLITRYKPGEQGFRNWSTFNRNVASSHRELDYLGWM